MVSKYCRLSSPRSDLIIKTRPHAEIIWWGSALKHFSPDDCASLERPVANGRLDIDTPLTLMAENALGLFSSPGLEGHRNGLDASPVFYTVDVEHTENTLRLTSEDSVAGLRLVSELVMTPSGILKVRHALTNLREGDWQINRFAITLPLAERAEEVMAFHGRWTREFQPHRVRLTHDAFVLENRRGRTSHEHFPALIVGTKYRPNSKINLNQTSDRFRNDCCQKYLLCRKKPEARASQ